MRALTPISTIPTYYFARQAVFALVGIGIMLFVSRINYQICARRFHDYSGRLRASC